MWYKFGEFSSGQNCQISGYWAIRLGLDCDPPGHYFDLPGCGKNYLCRRGMQGTETTQAGKQCVVFPWPVLAQLCQVKSSLDLVVQQLRSIGVFEEVLVLQEHPDSLSCLFLLALDLDFSPRSSEQCDAWILNWGKANPGLEIFSECAVLLDMSWEEAKNIFGPT